jgi:hypothetical protein
VLLPIAVIAALITTALHLNAARRLSHCASINRYTTCCVRGTARCMVSMNNAALLSTSIDSATLAQIEKWYRGKAREVIRTFAIPTLLQAAADGYWPKGASRKVKASLNKQSVAAKFARANRKTLEPLADADRLSGAKHTGWTIAIAMQYGNVADAPQVAATVEVLRPIAAALPGEEARVVAELLDTAAQWAADLAPVAALISALDATRPKPIIVLGTLSRTVADNVGAAMGIAIDTIECPPIEWFWVEEEVKGAIVRVPVGRIIWPDGTRHCQSRFALGSQCHACGHGIRNPWNWMPLVAQTATGPVSLWVGRDCARNLFKAEVSGDGRYER